MTEASPIIGFDCSIFLSYPNGIKEVAIQARISCMRVQFFESSQIAYIESIWAPTYAQKMFYICLYVPCAFA